MRYVVVGLSYRTAPVELRERMAVADDRVRESLARIKESRAVDEAMMIATCNRVEVYAVAGDPLAATKTLSDHLSTLADRQLDGELYRLVDDEAVQHIFRVTASLDSMVVGEAQITGQIKDAFAVARQTQSVRGQLGSCLARAFAVSKRVRNETGIARHPASISSVAVELAGRIFEDLASVSVLVVGAGEMAELAVRHLVSDGARRIHVTNRSAERAAKLAAEFEATAIDWDKLEQELEWADIVITSTASPEPIITRKMLSRVMRARKQRPVFIVDIAVPRDVEAKARRLSNVYLFAIDDLEKAVAENLSARRKEAKVAERIVEHEVAQFRNWQRKQQAAPLIKELRRRFSEIAHGEAERAARSLKLEAAAQRQALDRMAEAIVSKLLHVPLVEIKRSVAEGEASDLAEAVMRLFKIELAAEDLSAMAATDADGDVDADSGTGDAAAPHEEALVGAKETR
ncbi:MAG: glutamyl-tRNA reductase [Myxococcales bacterium]|nr:glutamyl-tRNA reductase [Myxococcales bacterium]